MSNQQLQLTTFEGVFDTEPTPVSVSWEQFTLAMSEHEERDQKEGRLWSPVQYRPGTTRGNAGVSLVTMAVCDSDEGQPPEPIEQQLRDAGLAHVVHSTYSHTEEHPKWRIIVPLNPVVNSEMWPELWPRLMAHLFDDAGDTAASDASRIYCRPSCRPGAPRFARHQDGEAFDVASLPSPEPRLEEPDDTEKVSIPGTSVLTNIDVLDRALKAKNGDKFKRLWDGNDSDYGDDTSKGDIALCNQLAFWTRCDPAQMDSLFRLSNRIRDKWDEVHSANRETYGQMTLAKAIANCTDVYEPTVPTTTLEPPLWKGTLTPPRIKPVHPNPRP